jgi:hypothetical protein
MLRCAAAATAARSCTPVAAGQGVLASGMLRWPTMASRTRQCQGNACVLNKRGCSVGGFGVCLFSVLLLLHHRGVLRPSCVLPSHTVCCVGCRGWWWQGGGGEGERGIDRKRLAAYGRLLGRWQVVTHAVLCEVVSRMTLQCAVVHNAMLQDRLCGATCTTASGLWLLVFLTAAD